MIRDSARPTRARGAALSENTITVSWPDQYLPKDVPHARVGQPYASDAMTCFMTV
jgi:hypothetical protein